MITGKKNSAELSPILMIFLAVDPVCLFFFSVCLIPCNCCLSISLHSRLGKDWEIYPRFWFSLLSWREILIYLVDFLRMSRGCFICCNFLLHPFSHCSLQIVHAFPSEAINAFSMNVALIKAVGWMHSRHFSLFFEPGLRNYVNRTLVYVIFISHNSESIIQNDA